MGARRGARRETQRLRGPSGYRHNYFNATHGRPTLLKQIDDSTIDHRQLGLTAATTLERLGNC
eukprot:11873879-Alexandrium_andersonii.AAC.1